VLDFTLSISQGIPKGEKKLNFENLALVGKNLEKTTTKLGKIRSFQKSQLKTIQQSQLKTIQQ
jgi:hypothetical protein